MYWLQISGLWYLSIFALGLIFYPLTRYVFGRYFFDHGYPFAKIIGLLLLSYLMFVLGLIKILPFSQISLFVLIVFFLIFNGWLIKKIGLNQSNNSIENRSRISLIICEELLFIASFLFWAFIRGQEPSIRSLEKLMDFGFIQSILRSKYFPPLDMWLSADPSKPQGYPINYYYFGHLTGAVLIKLSGVKPSIGYNLILASLFAINITQVFSLVYNLIYLFLKNIKKTVFNFFFYLKLAVWGLIGAFIVNLGGNLHTIYLFTKGYPNENPLPFWQILSGYNPTKYWYPNATRFIPFTIHEFPSYSYVVADLHGHVFDISFVLLTLALLFLFFVDIKTGTKKSGLFEQISKLKNIVKNKAKNSILSEIKKLISTNFNQFQLISTISFGFLTAVHYMTNAFDGPIYLLLISLILFIFNGFSLSFIFLSLLLIISFVIFSLPFSFNFSPFVSGIGINCSPSFLDQTKKFGPFLFDSNNCQVSPLWMLLVLWGFFWINFIIFSLLKRETNQINFNSTNQKIINLITLLFSYGTFLIVIPEFFYIKDIYPAHFRANTMFKLGYQAFIMMGIASAFALFYIKLQTAPIKSIVLNIIFFFFFFFVFVYPFFAIPSYYGNLKKPVELDGSQWISSTYPADKEIIDYLNNNITGQPVILEAQGDSYTDYERISAFTGLPTVAGWWVHEWLWRGSPDIVGKRIPDIVNIYESSDLKLTKDLISQYQVKYIIVSQMEKDKYKNLKEEKFLKIGRLIFQSSDRSGLIYQTN